ncbi:MAG: PPOX class probable F420-dependent enzyme [Candidatus Aldehydirespiratoraceae bacterium]|jgi:PPOX class probable F420-dependent enzyme
MEINDALAWAETKRHGVLITLRRDGRPQSSDIVFAVIDGGISISVTHDRAKTRNVIRDGRVVLHVTDPSSWSYVSIDATAVVSAVTTSPDDATANELITIYKAVAGEHDNWDEYRQAMISEGRCVVRVNPNSVTGQLH